MNQFTESPIGALELHQFVQNQTDRGISQTRNSLIADGVKSTLKVVDLCKVNKKAYQTMGYYILPGLG